MEYWIKNPAKTFEKGETSENPPKTVAETGRTARKATELTQKDSTAKPTKDFLSFFKISRVFVLRTGAKTEIERQERTDIKKPMSQAARGSISKTAAIAIPRLSMDFEPEKKIFER